MTISRPTDFHVLTKAGQGPFQREATIGKDEGLSGEWEAVIDNSQHLQAYLCRGSGAWVAPPKVSGVGTTSDQPLYTTTTGSWHERLVIPVSVSPKRWGETNSAIDFEIQHGGGGGAGSGGRVRIRVMNEARSVTYATVTTAIVTTKTVSTGAGTIAGAVSADVLLVVDLEWDNTTGSEHRLWSISWQVQEQLLADM